MLYSNFRGSGGGDEEEGQGATEAPDTLVAKQYLRIVDMISEGPVEGLNNGLQSIYIAGTPIENSDGTKNIDGFNVYGRSGTVDQTYVKGFEEQESEKSVGVEVKKDQPITRALELVDADAVRVSIGIPSLQSISKDSGSAGPTDVEIEIAIQTNGGGFIPQIIGTRKTGVGASSFSSPAAKTIRIIPPDIDKTGISVRWEGTESLNQQTVEFLVQRSVTGSGVWTTLCSKVFQGKAVRKDQLGGQYNNVIYTTYTRPSEILFFYDTTKKVQYDYRITVQSATNTNEPYFYVDQCEVYEESLTDIISGKCTSKYIKSYRLPLKGTGPYDVRVRRVTDDSSSTYLQNETHWETFTEIIDSKLTYPYTAYVAMSVDASQYSGIPERAYDVKGMIVDVPINYDPIHRTYTGMWDGGTFQRLWTDNPAWCLRDLITNNRYGLGEFVSVDHINNAAFYSIAKYCDELVPDGFGGKEPRYTCSLYIQGREEAFKVLKDMASIFSGMLYWSSGNIFAVADKKEDPAWLFTNANVINGEFTYQGSSKNTRHTVALVTYVDSRDRYQEKVEYVEDKEAVAKWGVRPISLTATGASSRGQAHRLGKNVLLSEQYLTETVTFSTGLEGVGSGIAPGSIIQVSDANRAGVRYGGRIISATANQVVLDSSIQVIPGATYTLSYITPDGIVKEDSITFAAASSVLMALGDGTTYLGISVPIVDISGKAIGAYIQEQNSTILNFTTPISNIPQRMAIWVLQANALKAQTFRVVGIKESEKCQYIINALAYNESKFDAVDLGIDFHEVPTTITERWNVPSPSNVVVNEELYIDPSGTILTRLNVSFDKPDYPLFDYHQICWRYSDGEWTEEPTTKLNFASIAPVEQRDVEISVEAVNSYGIHSSKTFVKHTVMGESDQVPVPINPVLYATPDVYGNVTKARLRVNFTKNQTSMKFTDKMSGLMLFIANFPFENWADVASGGVGNDLVLNNTSIIQEHTSTVLAGSTTTRLVVRTPGAPFDINVNHGGRFWGRLPGGEWRKCIGVDTTAVLFDVPHNITPVAGMQLEWCEISWADNRLGQAKMAILNSGTAYEIIEWGSMEQEGSRGPLRLANCTRGSEGTSVINADGKRLHYYPAPGTGTSIIRFPVECFRASGDLDFVGETDIDLSIPAGSFTSASAAVFATKPDGSIIRSYIVPVNYGGVMA